MTASRGVERVLLVGFMGSGKSTVGRRLAERLGWTFFDFDDEIEDRLGRTVREIFTDDGEPFFRDREAEVGGDLLSKMNVVLASGGGWPVRPGNWETVPRGTLSVWLSVAPETVARRLAGKASTRPLLAENDLFSEARTLMRERSTAYGRANHRVDTDVLTPVQIAQRIENLVNDRTSTHQNSEWMSN